MVRGHDTPSWRHRSGQRPASAAAGTRSTEHPLSDCRLVLNDKYVSAQGAGKWIHSVWPWSARRTWDWNSAALSRSYGVASTSGPAYPPPLVTTRYSIRPGPVTEVLFWSSP